jgi:type 2 lantibiotic biosynthesis protein LanM
MRETDGQPLEHAAAWYQALRLGERLASSAADLERIPYDPDRASRRFERWLAQPPFSDNGHFAARLTADGLTPPDLLRLLGEDADSLRQRHGQVPDWLREVEAAFAAPHSPGSVAWSEENGPGAGGSAEFHVLIEPIVRRGCERLRQGIAEVALAAGAGLEIDPDVLVRSLLVPLTAAIRHFLGRTLVLELQVARLEERLEGDTPEERFRCFINSLRRPEVALELLRTYPVLARFIVEQVARWEANSLELLRRLAADWDEIRRCFAPTASGRLAPGLLVEVKSGEGDPHRGGRSVALLRFASGFRLVYKPKSLAVDAAFQNLLRWAGDHGFEPGFRTIDLIDRGSYGWIEFVAAAPCRTAAEVRRFYQRQGGSMALLYLVEGTDFHHENVIAAGEYPVLVDLEALFHLDVGHRELLPQERRPGWSLTDSVLRSGLLPQRVWGNAERKGVDLSALGAGAADARLLYQGAIAEGTDEMRFGFKETPLQETRSRPVLDGEDVSFLRHTGDILSGFDQMYRVIETHREELLAPGGPLAAFAEVEVRVIFRQTRAYFELFHEGFHPYRLKSGLDRARFLDQLWKVIEKQPFLVPLVPFEHRDLDQGDIPYFTTRPGSRDVWTTTGERLADFLPESGLERAARRLARFGEEDRARQEWLIRSSLSTARLEKESPVRPTYPFRERPVPATREELLAAARTAGDRLAALAFEEAFEDADQAHWMHVEYAGTDGWVLRRAQADLYLGLSGIAFALGSLGSVTGEETYTRLARRALAAQRRILAEEPTAVPEIGGFSGRGGLIYVLTHLGVLWDDPALLDEAEELALDLGPGIERDRHSDVTIGAAGCLLALLGLHRVRPSEAVWRLALRCGERILENAQPMGNGLGWVVAFASPEPLAGMSHGAAGIALALLWLGDESGDERFRRAALAGLAYERSLYAPEHRNWPDLRTGAPESVGLEGDARRYTCFWCHGAPGIGLARLAGLPFLDDRIVRGEIEAAVETTLAQGFGQNHSLCHGDLGNLDFLLEAARATDDLALQERVGRLAGGILDGIETHGWLFGQPLGAEPLGLMLGLAGTVYGLARLAEPERLPNLLALAPPSQQRSETFSTYGMRPYRSVTIQGGESHEEESDHRSLA